MGDRKKKQTGLTLPLAVLAQQKQKQKNKQTEGEKKGKKIKREKKRTKNRWVYSLPQPRSYPSTNSNPEPIISKQQAGNKTTDHE